MASRARRPVVVLSIGALIPAIALGALALVANDKARQPKVATPPATVPQVLPDPLPTPLLSVRRSPTALAADRRTDLLTASVAPLADSIDGSSCLSVGLDDLQLVTRNSDLAVIPASNLKIVTAAVAIDVLGPGFTFTTAVMGPPPLNGVIEGDVYMVGGGDPVLSEQWYTQAAGNRKRPPLHATSVEALADALVAAGVTQITGQVLGDASRYDDERHPPGWSKDVRATTDGAPVGALVVNDSITSSGSQDSDPTASAVKSFVSLIEDRGIAVGGGSGSGTAPAGLGVLASVQSAPLTDIVNEMLATSDNLTAEMLVKEIGVSTAQSGTRTAGLQAVTDRLGSWALPTVGLVLTDGSGLSHDNQLTCATLAGVLQRGSATDAVGAGLARGGQDGSTLADAFQTEGLIGVLQGKTGSLHNPNEVKSLSGYYVTGAAEVAFVLILNGSSATAYTTAWDELGAALLAAAAGPSADLLAPRASGG